MKKLGSTHFICRETETQSDGVTFPKSSVGNPERKLCLVTPGSVLYCLCRQFPNWQPDNL